MSPSLARIIPARIAENKDVEAFPYFAATFVAPVSADLESDSEDDDPVLSGLSTPEEDATRLASVDTIIYEKLQEAERQAHDISRQAYEEGFAAGEQEGRSFGESQYAAYIERMQAHFKELAQAATLLSHASEEEILGLALAFGEYLAGQQIELSREGVRPLLTSILESRPFPMSDNDSPQPSALVIHMNPKDLEQLGGTFNHEPSLQLREDPELGRGSLRVEAPQGVLESTLERRRARLVEVIQRFQEKRLL